MRAKGLLILVSGLLVTSYAAVADAGQPLLVPGAYLQLGFGSGSGASDAPRFGFQMNYSHDFMQDVVLKAQPDAARLRPDAFQAVVSQWPFAVPLQLELDHQRLGTLRITGIDLPFGNTSLNASDPAASSSSSGSNTTLIVVGAVAAAAIIAVVATHHGGGGGGGGGY
jgi:hypothetical protein